MPLSVFVVLVVVILLLLASEQREANQGKDTETSATERMCFQLRVSMQIRRHPVHHHFA